MHCRKTSSTKPCLCPGGEVVERLVWNATFVAPSTKFSQTQALPMLSMVYPTNNAGSCRYGTELWDGDLRRKGPLTTSSARPVALGIAEMMWVALHAERSRISS